MQACAYVPSTHHEESCVCSNGFKKPVYIRQTTETGLQGVHMARSEHARCAHAASATHLVAVCHLPCMHGTYFLLCAMLNACMLARIACMQANDWSITGT